MVENDFFFLSLLFLRKIHINVYLTNLKTIKMKIFFRDE